MPRWSESRNSHLAVFIPAHQIVSIFSDRIKSLVLVQISCGSSGRSTSANERLSRVFYIPNHMNIFPEGKQAWYDGLIVGLKMYLLDEAFVAS